MRQSHNSGSGETSLNKADNMNFPPLLQKLLNRFFKNDYATFAAFVINIDFMKEFSMFFKYIDAKAVSKALDDIRSEFQEHFQAANSKIKDLQYSIGLCELSTAYHYGKS